MSDIKIQHEGREPLRAQIPRSVLRDQRLSFGARGLFAFLWDLPGGWEIRLAHLAALGPEGRDAIRARLKELERVGAIRIEEQRRDNGTISGKTWIMVNPDRWAVESPLSSAKKYKEIKLKSDIPTSAYTSFGKPNAKVLQGVKVLQEEAAAPRAHARGTADAAAAHSTKKRRTTRPSGIVTWDADDLPEAARIEQQHLPDHISAAVSALLKAGKQPVPGLVAREIERQHREHLAAEQRAATAARIAAADTMAIDPIAQANGAQMLPPAMRAIAQKTTHLQEATP